MQPCENDWPGGWDCPMKISGHFIHFFPPSKSHFSVLFGMGPPPGDLHLSIPAPKWAALTLILCTQHCVPVSHLHVPHENSTSTCFRTVFQVSSCLTHLLTARTVFVVLIRHTSTAGNRTKGVFRNLVSFTMFGPAAYCTSTQHICRVFFSISVIDKKENFNTRL